METAVQEGGSDPANDPRSVYSFDDEVVDRNRQVVFVKITRNLSADNRRAIEEHELRWNGKRGGWKGMAEIAAIKSLREKFGDRLAILSGKRTSEGGSDCEEKWHQILHRAPTILQSGRLLKARCRRRRGRRPPRSLRPLQAMPMTLQLLQPPTATPTVFRTPTTGRSRERCRGRLLALRSKGSGTAVWARGVTGCGV
jgi:hypothetical protein